MATVLYDPERDGDVASLHVHDVFVRLGAPHVLRAIARAINRRAGR